MNLRLYFVDRNRLLRAVLDAGQAIDALGHVHRFGLAALNLEHGLRAHIRAGAVSIALALVDSHHVHVVCVLLHRMYKTANV